MTNKNIQDPLNPDNLENLPEEVLDALISVVEKLESLSHEQLISLVITSTTACLGAEIDDSGDDDTTLETFLVEVGNRMLFMINNQETHKTFIDQLH